MGHLGRKICEDAGDDQPDELHGVFRRVVSDQLRGTGASHERELY